VGFAHHRSRNTTMLIPVDSIDDPRLAYYRDLNERNLTRHSGHFIAEGDKVVLRLIRSRFEVASILAEPCYAEEYESEIGQDVPIYVAPRELLQQTVGFHFHRGVVACGRRKPVTAAASLLAKLELPRSTVVACPDVQDPTNLGSIIRTAAAFGCGAILLGNRCADPFSRRVLRVSMGAALELPIIESKDLQSDLATIREANFEIVAAVIEPTAQPLAEAERGERLALLLGSEGHGLGDSWLQLADRRVTIPMQLGIDSLNVSVAAAVLLYHFCGRD
jgi:tRNA G18 (ribose-2'-O)-methylase SpoU